MTDNYSLFKSSPCPATSPWGAIQDKRELAPGIWSVSTAGHGGIKLSRERNAAMPDYMRNKGGWYEEDCEWAKVAVVFPIGFQHTFKDGHGVELTAYSYALEVFRNWHPNEYETFTGIKLKPGDSLIRDEEVFRVENFSNFIVVSACGSWASWVPEGNVGVKAKRNSDNTQKWFLVDQAEYDKRDRNGYVIDLSRDTEIQKPEGS